jgi:flagella basal body P-ring formation protein FlgA
MKPGLFLIAALVGLLANGSAMPDFPAPIKKALLREIFEQFPCAKRVELQPLQAIDSACAEGTSVRFTSQASPLGVFSFATDCRDGKTRTAQARSRVVCDVAISTKPIRHGESIESAQVRFTARDLSDFAVTGFFPNPQALREGRAQGFIPAGALLTHQNVSFPKAVNRLERVDICLSKGDLSVHSDGIALENGSVQDWIRVENPMTKKILRAKVVGRGRVSVTEGP